MSDVTRILAAIDQGDPGAASQLLPLVYDELRKLAAQRMAHEQPGQTLEATALVHEAYLRLVGDEPKKPWDGRAHFRTAFSRSRDKTLRRWDLACDTGFTALRAGDDFKTLLAELERKFAAKAEKKPCTTRVLAIKRGPS